ncbi:MAG: dihydrodipicolinate synthase family protein, partial [Clostridia bacterium]|nr:dihydrodipicolinate synthase family protein [Clostridia bacterium]
RKHFYAMADIGLPLLLYNVPSRTGIDLSVEDVTALAAHPFIVGIKEASQDIEKATALRFALPQEFGVYSGNDGMFLPYLSFGADGLISVVSNLVPRTMTNIYRQFQDGKQEAAAKQFKSLYPLIRQLFCETNPARVKYAMSLQEIGDGSLRLPLSPISALHQEQIKNTIESLHLS